jgi:two-component system, NarL family, sensor histidine kinase UhpB
MTDPALQAFLAENGLFQSLIDQSSLMVIVFDREGECVFSSRARLAFRGRTIEQDRGWGWLETVHPDDKSSVTAGVLEAIQHRSPFAIEHRAFRADGVCRRISSQGLPWFTPANKYLGHVALSVDITDQRDVDAAAPSDEPRALRRLIENAHDMVYRRRFFPTNSFDYIGGAVLAITGRTAADFYAKPGLSAECVHPDDLHLVATAQSPGQMPAVAILRWIHPDGRVVHAEHRRVPVYDDAGQLIAIEGIARDVTEFVEAERRLRESEEQLRQLAGRMHNAREAERAQVARELHDELGQTLTALKLDISRMMQALRRDQMTPSLVDRLQSLIGLSDIGLATVKRIATTLRPPTLDHLGLAEAIHWESLTFKARAGLRCNVRTNKSRSALSSEQQTALFRIFQEAMTNIVRHAHASAVQVTLTERAERFEMIIRDNGRGITESERENPNALGLLGMRERTALMGGLFRISGRKGKGTVLSIEVPVPTKAADAQSGQKAKVAR